MESGDDLGRTGLAFNSLLGLHLTQLEQYMKAA
jgi:hypothetical protein